MRGFSSFASERRWLVLVSGAALLGGCAGRAARVASPTASSVSEAPRAPAAVTPSQPPLALDPAGREAAVARAMLVVNTPYRWGGNTPDGGFDCSGLVHYVFSDLRGANRLPRSTAQWAAATVPVDEARLQRGDLVFFNTSGAPFSHMGIYVGQGQFVHAPSSGGTVRKERVASRYFAARYQGGRRVFSA